MKDLIAFCGLDCETCEARIATINNDDTLREKVSKEWSKLNQVEITPEMINCVGCRVDGVKTPYCNKLCPIKNCATSNNVSICRSCTKLSDCQTIRMITDNNEIAKKNIME